MISRLLAVLIFLIPTAFLAVVLEKTLLEVASRGTVARVEGKSFDGFTICPFRAGPVNDFFLEGLDLPSDEQALPVRAGIAAEISFGLLCLGIIGLRPRESFLRLGLTVLAAASLLQGVARPFVDSLEAGSTGLPGWLLSMGLVGAMFVINLCLFQLLEAWLGASGGLSGGWRLSSIALLGLLGALAWWIPGRLTEHTHVFHRLTVSLLQVASASLLLLRTPRTDLGPIPLRAAFLPSTASWGILVAFLAWAIVPALPGWAPMPSSPALSGANGYSALIEAAGRCEWNYRFDTEEPSLEELQRTVEKNTPAVTDARQALDLECRIIPSVGDDDELFFGTGSIDLGRLRQAFAAASRLLAHEGDLEGAADFAVDAVRLGVTGLRGGVLINWLMSCGLQMKGLEEVHRLVRRLGLSAAEKSFATMIILAGQREPLEETMATEKKYRPVVESWWRRQELKRGCIPFRWRNEESLANLPDLERKILVRWHLLLAELSIRVHEARTGRLPESLDAVSPSIPAWILEDPYASNGGRIIYRPDAVRYALYSVGPNQKDDGGGASPRGEEDPGGDDISLED